jgi:hypothetical protein
VTVVSANAVVGAKPDGTTIVFINGIYMVTTQTILFPKMRKRFSIITKNTIPGGTKPQITQLILQAAFNNLPISRIAGNSHRL